MTRFVAGFFIVVVACVIAIMVWLGFTGWQAKQASDELRTDVDSLLADGQDGDVKAAIDTVTRIGGHAADLDSTLNSMPWSWAAQLPGVGDTLSALGVLSRASAATLNAPGALEYQSDRKASSTELLAQLAPGLDIMADASEGQVAAVSDIRDENLFSVLRPQIRDARQQYLDLAKGLESWAGAAQALPTVLGYDGERRWAVFFQNPSEARGAGGLLGGYVLAKVKDGRIKRTASDTNNSLRPTVSLQGIPVDTKRLWGADLSKVPSVNLDRHFPYAAKLMARTLPTGQDDVDDIISMDPVGVAALMKITGPVSAHGVQVTSTTAVKYFTEDIYLQFPDPDEKDQVVVDLLSAVLDKLGGSEVDLPEVWKAVASVADDGNILMASTHAQVQQQLERTPVGGAVPTASGSWTSLAVNDFAGSKMDSFIQVDVRYEAASLCEGPTSRSRLVATVHNSAPMVLSPYADLRQDEGSGPSGSTKVNLAAYGPEAAALGKVLVDGRADGAEIGESRGHPVWKRSLTIERDESRRIVWEFDEPYRPDIEPVFSAQPMVKPIISEVAAPGFCMS